MAFRQDTRNVHYVACSTSKCDFCAKWRMLQNRGEQSRLKMEKILVIMEKNEKMEKILVILEKIIVLIRCFEICKKPEHFLSFKQSLKMQLSCRSL